MPCQTGRVDQNIKRSIFGNCCRCCFNIGHIKFKHLRFAPLGCQPSGKIFEQVTAPRRKSNLCAIFCQRRSAGQTYAG
jgi:hypothetical protein